MFSMYRMVSSAVGCWAIALCVGSAELTAQDAAVRSSSPHFFEYLQSGTARMIGYTPSELDPRNPGNNFSLKTSSIQADLQALSPAFNGLVLYGYHEACTPRIVAIAEQMDYAAVLLAIWDPKSMAEVDGVAALAEQYRDRLAIGVLVGNEGIIFGRYEQADLAIAHARLRFRLGETIPLSTSEPLVGYEQAPLRDFGDFLCPNIHPVFDLPQAAASEAVTWVKQQADRLGELSGKPVVVKETGFPHAGDPRYTPQSQQEFWKSYTREPLLVRRGERWISYHVAFEAFDLPWKSEASGLVIEKSWGLLDSNRQPLPAFSVWQTLVPTPP